MHARRSPSLRTPLIVAIVGVVLVVAFGFILRRSAFDLPVDVALNQLHTGAFATFGDLMYKGFGPVPAILGTAVITAIVLLARRSLRIASTLAVTVAVTWLPSAIVKIVVGRPRPSLSALANPPALQPDASYPSGHAVFVTALTVTAIMLALTPAFRALWAVIGVVVLALLALALLSDGVHFPTDILASIVWAVTLAPLVRAVWDRLLGDRLGRVDDAWAARRARGRAAV
jgi:membrane-associated phospholipid phosphatase